MPSLDEGPIIELGKNPLPGASPCGAEIGDDEQYIFINDEIGKLDRIEADAPDWFRLEQDATSVLRSKSKDLEVATALGLALFKRCKYAGLAAVLGMLTEMVNGHWDGLFPTRPRRRKALIESMADRFTEVGVKEPKSWLQQNEPAGDDFDALDQCVARIEALGAALTGKMPDEKVELGKLVRGLKERAAKRPKPDAPAAEAAAAGADGGAAAAAPAAAGAGFAVGEPKDAGGALNAVLGAATFLRKADPTDPVAYALVRVVKWAKVLMPTSDAAKFQIPSPEASKLDALNFQMANAKWEFLLKEAEGAFRAGDPLWLDLQRYSCAAMQGLGPTYDNARHAVIALTAGLVRRLGAGLFELKFANGTPLCGGETRMWIDTEVCPPAKGGGGGDNGKLSEALDKARALAGGGKIKDAVQTLAEGLATATQRRERFLWRLRIAELCFGAQKVGLATPLLEDCAEEVRRHHIDEWEPSLAVQVAQTLYRCHKSLLAAEKAPTAEALQNARDSYTWLCQLDPLAALDAEPAGK